MIPEIGVVVAAYVMTRMLALLTAKTERSGMGTALVTISALLTILVSVIAGIDLALAGLRGVTP